MRRIRKLIAAMALLCGVACSRDRATAPVTDERSETRAAANGEDGEDGGAAEATLEELCDAVCPRDAYFDSIRAACGGDGPNPDREECLAYCRLNAELYYPRICWNEVALSWACNNTIREWNCAGPGTVVRDFDCIPHDNAMAWCVAANGATL
jgi:hypothetical protein